MNAVTHIFQKTVMNHNELIVTLKANEAENFDGLVYYSESQGFGMKTKSDGKAYLVSDDGSTSFELSPSGIAEMQKEEKQTIALVAEEQK
jgi:hypothetical protein